MNRLTSNGLILEEIKHILKYEDNKDESVISLYDLSILVRKENFNFNRMAIINTNKEITDRCNNIRTIVNGFNYDTEELMLTLIYDEHYKVNCTKENGKLNIKVLNNKKQFGFLNFHKKEISDIYDEFMKYKNYMTERTLGCKSTNSSFLVNITSEEVSIFTKKNIDDDQFKFFLSSRNSDIKYVCITDSEHIKILITDIENKIFKNIYVKIENCPMWIQEKLNEINQRKLTDTKMKKKTKKHC